jgi:ribosomal protein S18 acetylase RimI-like enzyme
MDDWQRAIAFMRDVDERTAQDVVPFAFGRALINRRFNWVYDANYLVADQLAGATAEALIRQAERIQGAAGLSHRRVNVDDQAAAENLREDFRAQGYKPERFVIMVRKRPPDRTTENPVVREVEWPAIEAARRLRRKDEPWATPRLIEQIAQRHRAIGMLVSTRYFAAMVDGQAVSSCELRVRDGLAQVEDVETLAAYRKRGLSRAVVTAALAAARDQEFVFLVADVDDWPQHFYARLGFDPVGIESRFLRVLDVRA